MLRNVRLKIEVDDENSTVVLGHTDEDGKVFPASVKMSSEMMLRMAKDLTRAALIQQDRLAMQSKLADAKTTPGGILIPAGVKH